MRREDFMVRNDSPFRKLDTANLPSPGVWQSPPTVSPPTVSDKTPSTMSYPHDTPAEHHGNVHPDVAHHVRELHTHAHVHLVHNPDAVRRETVHESLQPSDPAKPSRSFVEGIKQIWEKLTGGSY